MTEKKASNGEVGCFLMFCMAFGWMFLSWGIGDYYESEALGCIVFGSGVFLFGFLLLLLFMFGGSKKKKKKEKEEEKEDEQETSSGDS
jgi:hypothetical protein